MNAAVKSWQQSLQQWLGGNAAMLQGLMAPLLVVAILGLMVLPIPAWLLDTFFTFNIAVALVVLHPLACDASLLEPVLVRLYGLTTAECRVAVKLLELESIHLVAASLNRSEETIRSQIKSVFAKTGTHSQAQLLKLLYALGHS